MNKDECLRFAENIMDFLLMFSIFGFLFISLPVWVIPFGLYKLVKRG